MLSCSFRVRPADQGTYGARRRKPCVPAEIRVRPADQGASGARRHKPCVPAEIRVRPAPRFAGDVRLLKKISAGLTGRYRNQYVLMDYLCGRLRISLASAGVATSLPRIFASLTALSTISPLLFARTPFSR